MAGWDNSDTRASAFPSTECCIIYSSIAYLGRYLFTALSHPNPITMALRGVVSCTLELQLVSEAAFLSRRI